MRFFGENVRAMEMRAGDAGVTLDLYSISLYTMPCVMHREKKGFICRALSNAMS